MAYPDFSEFSFGYAVVRQIEQQMLGQWAVPRFPTQPQEADAGYDVDFLSHGVPLFIQFKRSEVMQRRSCKECRDPSISWTLPIYRMHLHQRDGYRQHMLLRALERSGNTAIYCTSTVPAKRELDHLYASNRVFEAAAVFWPLEIELPSLHEPHHVAFNWSAALAAVYSEAGTAFEPRTPTFAHVFRKLRGRAETDTKEEVRRLEAFVQDFQARGAEAVADAERATIGEPDNVEYEDDVYYTALPGFDATEIALGRRDALARIRDIESVVTRAALIAYFEMDAFLVSVSKKALRV